VLKSTQIPLQEISFDEAYISLTEKEGKLIYQITEDMPSLASNLLLCKIYRSRVTTRDSLKNVYRFSLYNNRNQKNLDTLYFSVRLENQSKFTLPPFNLVLNRPEFSIECILNGITLIPGVDYKIISDRNLLHFRTKVSGVLQVYMYAPHDTAKDIVVNNEATRSVDYF